MLLDLVIIAAVVRLLLNAAQTSLVVPTMRVRVFLRTENQCGRSWAQSTCDDRKTLLVGDAFRRGAVSGFNRGSRAQYPVAAQVSTQTR